jgi:AhpD family alkylhydroperoxidase
MSTSAEQFFTQWKASLQKLRNEAPDVTRAFGGHHTALMKEGTLPLREKELIALGVSIAQGCTDCIYLHTESALKAGGSRSQVIEAASVAVMMASGPAFVHLPAVLDALDHLKSA